MNRRRTVIGIAFIGIGAGLGYGIRAWAAGIPSTAALTYAGMLEDANGPVTGSHNIQVIFYDAATAGNNLCQSATAASGVAAGHFSVSLPDTCTMVVGGNPNVWVDVLVDGSDTGRTKVGAVPYAVEAAHASAADTATNATTATTANAAGGTLAQLVVPAGAVIAFNLGACPTGWSPYPGAVGRVVVGLTSGASPGSTIGSDNVTLDITQMPAHSHTVTDTGHHHTGYLNSNFVTNNNCTGGVAANVTVGGSGYCQENTTDPATTGITIQNAGGGAAFDNRQASVALLYCVKN